MRRILQTALLAAAVQGLPAAIIYDNTLAAPAIGVSYTGFGLEGIGDEITLGSGSRELLRAHTTFYNYGTASGSFDATFQFFDGGTPLGSAVTLSSIAIDPSDYAYVSFDFPLLTLPNTVQFLISVTNQSVDLEVALGLLDAVTTGSSSNTNFLGRSSGGPISSLSTSFNVDNVYLQLESADTPEPATMVLSGLVLAGMALVRRKR